MIKEEELSEVKSRSKSYVFRTMLNGLLLLLPVIILIFVIVFLVRFVLKILQPVTEILSPGTDTAHWGFQLLAILIVGAIFFLIGLAVNTRIGKSAFVAFESAVLKPIPFYSSISSIVGQFNNQEKRPFKDVVLCDPYKSGALMTGFVVEEIDSDMVVIYVPTAPNPTNGFVFHIKKADVFYTNAKTEDAMASVIGLGAGSKKIFGSKIYEKIEDSL